MEVLIPKAIDETILTSNVPFPAAGETEWTAGTYAQGGTAYVQYTNYESLINSNTDNPVDGEKLSPPTWLNLGGVKRYRMFDANTDTQTINPDTIDVTFTYSGLKDTLVLFNTDANEVTVTTTSSRLTSPDVQTESGIDRSLVTGMWGYFKAARSRKRTFVFSLPPYADTTINVLIDNTGSDAKCGNMAIGYSFYLGEELKGMSPRIVNKSRYIYDAFQRRTTISKAFVRELDVSVKYDTVQHDNIQRTLESLVGTPTAWIGSQLYATSVIWGEASFTPEISNTSKSDAKYVIEAPIYADAT
ncbi:MAG: hypothetical protein ACPHUL_00790 [Marinomonas gallaica]